MCFRAGWCACPNEHPGGADFDVAKACSSALGKLLRQPPVPKGTVRPPRAPHRLAYDMCRAFVHIYPLDLASGQQDLWLHLGFGNLASGDYTVVDMVLACPADGEGHTVVRWHGSLKPHSHYRLLHGVDKAVDWDFELLEIDDAQPLVPAPFLPNSVRLRPFAPRCIRPLWRVQKPPRLRKLPIRSPLALEPISDGQAHDEEDNPPGDDAENEGLNDNDSESGADVPVVKALRDRVWKAHAAKAWVHEDSSEGEDGGVIDERWRHLEPTGIETPHASDVEMEMDMPSSPHITGGGASSSDGVPPALPPDLGEAAPGNEFATAAPPPLPPLAPPPLDGEHIERPARVSRKNEWGPFLISAVASHGTQIGWGATCKRHSDIDDKKGTQCKKQLPYGKEDPLSDEESIVLLKQWLLK